MSFTVSAPGGLRSASPATAEADAGAASLGPASLGPASLGPASLGVVATGATAATRTFGRRAAEVPAARRFVREVLADHPGCYDAELLTCELVTNAVRHATDAAHVTVAVMRLGPAVHVDVVDNGCAGVPAWRETGGHDEDGRGFQLVNALAVRWGFLRERSGTCVWFEIAP